MNVQMPDGTIITDVPENITQKEILARYNKFKAPPVPQNKGTLGDLGTALKQGVARIPEGLAGLADIPVELATGKNYITEAGKKLADVTGIHPSDYAASLEAEKSAGYQQAQAEANALWKAHDEGKASYGDIAAFYAKHPALTATNVAQSAPSMLVGGAYGRALKGVGSLSAVARGAIGEGAVSAGQLNAAMNEEGGGSRQKALAAALGGAGTGLIAGGSGALARRMGVIDPETFLAGKSGSLTAKELADFEQAAQRGIAARLGLGALQEGVLQELPQSVQEQMFQNWGTGKPIMEGVGRQAIEGLLAGAVLGGGFNVLGRGDVNQQIQDRKDADAQQAQRQATGVMEQQPLFAPQEMPIPEPTLTPQETPEAEPISTIAPEAPVVEQPVPEGQGDLFTARGAPSPAAKASVEAARLQGLPSQIEALNQTPEGRAELAGNMKMYFPELKGAERNKTRQAIQQGVYGVESVAPVEGTLTPDLLQTYGITPRSKQYKALAGANLADPTTYNLLTTAAATSTDFGVKANRILEAFPQYNPIAAQPDLFGVPNAPQTQTQAEPVQADLFGTPADGMPVVEPGTEQGMGQPVQQQGAAPAQVEEPVGGGVDVYSGAPVGNIGQPAASTNVQPSALAPIPPRAAKQAAAALKKEPISQAWDNFDTGIAFAALPKAIKDQVRNAHTDNYLNQGLADQLAGIVKGNARAAAASAAIKPDVPLDEAPTAQAAPVTQAEPSPEPTTSMPDIAEPFSQTDEVYHVYANLQMSSPIQAAQWLADNIPDKGRRVIAQAVARQLEKFDKAGYKQKLYITQDGGKGRSATMRKGSRGAMGFEGGDVTRPFIILTGTEHGVEHSGLTFRTALHELTHMATRIAVMIGERTGDPNVARLAKLRKHVIKFVKDKYAKGEDLSSVEKGALGVDGYKNNAFDDVDELVAWSLSNKDMQTLMESIPYKGNQSLWSEFVTIIRNLMGIPATANTALSEVLSASEELLNADISSMDKTLREKGVIKELDPQAQAQAQQAIASMSGMYAQSNPQPVQTGAQVAANIGNLVRTNPGGAIEMLERKINAWRNKVVWRGATLADDIQRANDNAFRNAYGNVRADMLMSQAENTQNITESVFTFGGVEITPDGTVRAKVADHSIDGVFRQAKNLADRIGTDIARELITKTFYAWRAQALLTLPRNEWPINWQQNPSLIPTQAQINAGMAAFNQFPELEAMRTEFIGAKNEAVKFLKQAGFLTAEKAKAFLADDSYAPWFRLKEYDDTLPGLGNMGRMVDLKQMQALKGGSEEVNDMLENMAQVVSWFVRSGVSNHTANQALKTMQDMGTATPQRSRPTGTNPDNIVMTYVDGKRMFWTVSDPLQLQAFQSVKAINSPVIKAMSKGLGTLRAGIVLFPAFPIRQVIMDTYRAYAQSGVEQPAKLVGKVFKSFLSGEAYKAMSDDILEMKKYGVVGSADFNLSDSTRGRAEAYGLKGPEKGITATWLRSPVYKALHNFAYSADLAVRLGVYRQTMEETGDKELAIARAREIINFQKSGNSELMLTLKQLIPFMGAYLQGTDVNYRSMIGRGNSMKSRKAAAAAFWGNMTTLAALTVAYTMAMSGEDEYEEQKGFITDRNFIIPGVGLLPVPPDIGFLSKVIPERITDYILQEGTDNPESVSRLAEGIRGAAGAAYLPPAAVYGITPAIELGLNRSFFTDIPIVGQHMQGLEPFQQYTSSTSELAKTAGGIANMSPMQIDYLLKALGGTVGGALIQMLDVFATDDKIAREKNVILGTFQKKEVGGRYTEEFYETRELIDRTYNTAKALYELGDQAKLDEYINRPEIQQRLSARQMVGQMDTMLQDARKARAAIENDTTLSPDEKRQQVNELQATVEQMLKEAGIRKMRSEIE